MDPEQIRKRLRSRQTQDRIGAVRQASGLDWPDRQALLLEALADKSPYVGALAAEALGESADAQAATVMTERFGFLSEDGPARDPGCHIRANLAFALGRLQYAPASDALRVGIRTVQIEPVGGSRSTRRPICARTAPWLWPRSATWKASATSRCCCLTGAASRTASPTPRSRWSRARRRRGRCP